MNIYSFLLLLLTMNSGVFASSAVPASVLQTQEEYQSAIDINSNYASLHTFDANEKTTIPSRPVEEVAKYKFLLLNHQNNYEIDKSIFAKELPEDMILVVLTDSANEKAVRQKYSSMLKKDQLIVAVHQHASTGFWARDSFPFPVVSSDGTTTELAGHKYFRTFEGEDAIASASKKILVKHDFVFVGGNLQADEDGNCFVIDSTRLFNLEDKTIENAFGCKKITRLPHLAGIGDVDEVLKVLPQKNVLTNQEKYLPTLKSLGYQVTLLPVASGYRTYANALIINGKAFIPSYGTSDDDVAAKIYESFGYQVVKIDTRKISDTGLGAIHCMSMAYPDINLTSLLNQMGYSISL